MLNVALTGNVAAGKSTVLQWLAAWGATVIDADRLVREIQAPGSPVLQAIVDRFGPAVVGVDGTLDRESLRGQVMADADALASLNALVHPEVERRRAALLDAAAGRGDCIVVSDIPLLFEVLDPATFDAVILVDAPVAVRRDRLTGLRGLSAADADRLIASQLPADRKRAGSTFVLDNDQTLDHLQDRAREVWHRLRAQAAVAGTADGGTLLAIFADPVHAAAAAGGALARYADAGLPVLLSALDGASGPLDAVARALGVSGTTTTPHAQGVEQAMAAHRPRAVITPPPGTDQPIHLWAREAAARHGAPTVWAAGFPADHPGVARIPALRLGEPTARLDIRPWHDRKRAALASLALEPEGPVAAASLSHEWYAGPGRHAAPGHDLFAPRRG